MKQVIVFTQDTCAPCKLLKDELSREHIEYQELDMSKADDYTLELATTLRIRKAPTIVVKGDQIHDETQWHMFKDVKGLKEHLGL